MRFHVIRSQTPNPAQSPLRVIEHESVHLIQSPRRAELSQTFGREPSVGAGVLDAAIVWACIA